MGTIGVRELRQHLSRVLADVQRGESVIVTKDGEPVARIAPVYAQVPEDVQRVLASGKATWGGHLLEPHEPIVIGPGPDVADILLAQRDALSGQ